MSADEKKIATPTDQEVAQYAGGGPPEANAEAAPVPAASEADEWKDKYLRARAELSNYQKRAQKDRTDSIRYAVADLARALLPVLDNLDRAVEAATGATGGTEALAEGARLTRDMFVKVLKEFDVTEIEAEGQPFDPAVHEALMEQPSDKHPNRTVLQQVAKGYRLHDRVLRPARVIVSKGEVQADGGKPADQE
jgi:molecular chaperone GrpE